MVDGAIRVASSGRRVATRLLPCFLAFSWQNLVREREGSGGGGS